MTNPTPEAPTPQPAPQSQSQPAPLSQGAQKLHNYLQMIDPNQRPEGVGLNEVRPIYPKIGWNVILGHCKELEDVGKLTKRFVPGPSGKGGYEAYTWQ